MSAGHFCGNLLPERHITHGLSAPGVIFSSIFSSFFLQWGVTFSKQSGFNKTFCICHRKGWGGVCGAKSGKQLTLFLWQARKLCRIWQERLHEVPQRKAFIYLLCRTVIYLFFAIQRLPCISRPLPHLWPFLSFNSITFSHLFPPSGKPLKSPSLLWDEHTSRLSVQ